MLSINEKQNILGLLKAKLPVLEIAKRTGKSIGTIYKLKNNSEENIVKDSEIDKISAKILPYIDIVQSERKNGITNNAKLYYKLKDQGFSGSYGLLNSYVNQIKSRDTHYKPSKHVETGPGEQGQVDWGYCGTIKINGETRKLSAFILTLSYSRVKYAEFTVKQNLQTFQNCHMNAFDKVGIPQGIYYDNVKTVNLRTEKLPDGTKRIHYNLAFLDFARYYNFKVELCPPYWPRAKGKVERGVGFLKHHFLNGEAYGKTFHSLEELNQKLNIWLSFINQSRLNRATEKKPVDLWEEERPFLSFTTDIPRYNNSPFEERICGKDCLIKCDTNFYSVPFKYAYRKLLVRKVSQQGIAILEIYHQDVLIAKHLIPSERNKWIIQEEHEIEKQLPNARKKRLCKSGQSEINKYWQMDVATRDLTYYDNLI